MRTTPSGVRRVTLSRVCGLLLFLHIGLGGLATAEVPWPIPDWQRASPEEVGLSGSKLQQARDYALSAGGSGYVIYRGKLVISWGDPKKRYDLKSTTKSIAVTAMGLALQDGKLSWSDRAMDRHPSFGVPPQENASSGWLEKITLWHLAVHTAGFAKPGGFEPLLFEPGTRWHYSDGGPNWLAEIITVAYRRDVNELLFERVFRPLGITEADLVWRTNAYRPQRIEGITRREFGSGISANVDAMARIGYLYLREGYWVDKQILPREFVAACRHTPAALRGLPEHDAATYGNASDHYGLLWWNNSDGTLPRVPRDAFWSWGLYDSLIVVIPSLDIVVARAGSSWPRRAEQGHYDVLAPFLEPLAEAAQVTQTASGKPPYPPSAIIHGIDWAPASLIIRQAEGSDNWPLTWADDGHLYTAYGDGWGFTPKLATKLSLGFARLLGNPPDLHGENIRSETGEAYGDGPRGKKASGLLMVDGRLYLWARNVGNAQLAWSDDHAQTWTWAPWKFTESFGFPTFLNFGQNYVGARDDYVYVYSLDNDSPYEPADAIVLARVPRRRIADRSAYEFFEKLDNGGQPHWTKDIQRRGPVFVYPGRCYRFAVSFHAATGRYLLTQVLPKHVPQVMGGFGIYEAPEPWGPWATVFFTERWDVDPGECCSLPTKWMSADGRTVHLVFSGQDSFCVRQGMLRLRKP